MNSFFFELIYDYLKKNNTEAAQKIAKRGNVNRGGAAVIDGVYYPRPLIKVKMEAENQTNSFDALLFIKSDSKHYKTCYELYCHIMENKPIRLSKVTFKDNDSDKSESLKMIESKDLETIAGMLTAGFYSTELQAFYKNLKEQLQASLKENQKKNNSRISNIISNKAGKTSAEFTLLSTFIQEIDYGYALQGRMEQLKIFRENNDIDEAKYPIMHEHIVDALARGGHLKQIYAYTKTHHLNIKDFNAAIIKGLAAVGHHTLLEEYCLKNNIDTSTLIKGLSDLGISCEFLRDEDALRMLIDAKDSQYKKILQEALSNPKVFLLNNHFKFWDVLPQPEKNLDNHIEPDILEVDFEPSNKLNLSFPPLTDIKIDGDSDVAPNKWLHLPPLQQNTLWIYAEAIRKIMEQEHMSYTEVVKTYFFIDENDNDPKPLPDYVKPCYQWANSLNCLYSNNLNPLLKKEKAFEKRTILLQLTVEEIEKYIETIHLKSCEFTDDDTTQKLNALSDFKQKTVAYLGNKTQKNRNALAESATAAAAYFPATEEINTLDKAKNVGLGVLLGLLGVVLLVPTLGIGTAYAWKSAHSFFKKAEGTRSNLKEIQEVLRELKESSPQTTEQPFTL